MDIVLFAIFFCLVPMYSGGAAFSESTPGALFAMIGTLILFMLGAEVHLLLGFFSMGLFWFWLWKRIEATGGSLGSIVGEQSRGDGGDGGM